jgi:predicted nucleic acid-binding protein
MTEMIFADTFYWVALLSPRDAFHNQAFAITAKLGKTKIITTDEVLSFETSLRLSQWLCLFP